MGVKWIRGLQEGAATISETLTSGGWVVFREDEQPVETSKEMVIPCIWREDDAVNFLSELCRTLINQI